jgi:hypothetical protein
MKSSQHKRSSKRKKRRSPKGTATNALIHSCEKGKNDKLFVKILSLYVEKGSRIADVTFGKGVFWNKVALQEYQVLATDSRHAHGGTDCRDLPYKDGSIDCVV